MVRLQSPAPVRIEHHWRRLHSSVQQPTEPAPQFSRCSKMSASAVLIELSQQVSKTLTQLRLLLTPKDGCPLPTVPTSPAPKCHCVVPEFRLFDFHCKVTKVHSSQHLHYTSMRKFSGVRTYHLPVRTPSHCGAIAAYLPAPQKTKRHGRLQSPAVPSLQHWLSAASMRPVNN